MSENNEAKTLDSRVREVWRRGRTLHLTAGSLAFFRWAVILFLAGMALDWLTHMPAAGRIVILVVLLAVAAYKGWCAGWKMIRPFNATREALRMEKHHGGLESLLVTAVQLREAVLSPGTSESMRDATCRKAEEVAATLQPKKVVHYDGLRRPAVFAAAFALLIGGFAVVNSPFLAAGLARIFPPWMSVAYPTRTQLNVVSGDMIVKEGTPSLIRAKVSGVIPKDAELALRTGTGKPREHTLRIKGGVCEYPIGSAYRDFEYRIIAGDARSEWHKVEVIPSPRIKRAELGLEFPEYTDRATETVDALTVSVPEGTRINWKLTLDRTVSGAMYVPAGGEPQPLELSADGRTVTMTHLAKDSRSYSFSWEEKAHGFLFTSPNHYLQVAADQTPRVELTAPKANLYATLGRKLDLALRARDDHGIAEAAVAYRVNKIEEEKVSIPAEGLGEGVERQISWDYRTALPDLVIGDTVSFVVEVADKYPGAEGPYRARSQARRITFLSEEDYLAQIARQRQILLTQLRSVYREERAVHETIQNLDPSAAEFLQTCQLEAVRQDLMRERLMALADLMKDLLDDLAANNIKDEAETATLVRLTTTLENIAEERLGKASSSLRDITATSGEIPDAGAAVKAVDEAARELGCQVLLTGFLEATEVMARELHAIAETQARLRLRAMLSSGDTKRLANEQEEQAQWITRLFGTLPKDRESTIEDALVAFNLTRLIKELSAAGIETKMAAAVSLIRKDSNTEAAATQADVIRLLLAAEFRLRVGAEREALVKAEELFQAQASALKKMREEIAALAPGDFGKRRDALAQAQTTLQRKLDLLLMPAVPATRAQLFDEDLPTPPAVGKLLTEAEEAMKKGVEKTLADEQDNAATEQQKAESAFVSLTGIVQDRLADLSERDRVSSMVSMAGKRTTELAEFVERQLVVLEQTEDTGDDGASLVRISQLQQALADDVGRLQTDIAKWAVKEVVAEAEVLPLASSLRKAHRAMTDSIGLLKDKKPEGAIAEQESALDAMEGTGLFLERKTAELTALSATLTAEWIALAPGPFVADIQAEQRDLVEAVPNAKNAELPQLAIVQKNLIHAVNAILEALDPLSHRIEAGTVFLFAKDDMDAAAEALEANDLAEAEDAGSFVAGSLQGLVDELGKVVPQYTYVLEVTEFLNGIISEGTVIRAMQGELRDKTLAAADKDELRALAGEQRLLLERAKAFGKLLAKAMGQDHFQKPAETMAGALALLESGDAEAAAAEMATAENGIDAIAEELGTLMTHFAVLLEPMLVQPVPEALFAVDVLALASQQKTLYRRTQTEKPDGIPGLAAKQQELAGKCGGFVAGSQSHPKLIAATKHMLDATAHLRSSARDAAIKSQRETNDELRHFVIEYVQEFVIPPGPPSPTDPVPTDPTESLGDDFTLFMPGAVSGGKPMGGRQEWEVLGRRERAALNENFARELPLEYREILQDYYEKLAE